MRVERRWVTAAALAAVGMLSVAGVAVGAGDSTATLQFTPDKAPKDTYRNGSLFVHTHTDYTGATKTSRAQLLFDDDLRIRTEGIPRCSVAGISGNLTMQQAMAACGNARVGSGRAQANLSTPGDVEGCVLAFNALDANPNVGGNQPGILLLTRLKFPPIGTFNCSNPASNGGGDVSVVLQGKLTGASGDLGTQLDVNNIPVNVPRVTSR